MHDLMHVGLQMTDISDDNLKFAKQIGVDNLVLDKVPGLLAPDQAHWDIDTLTQLRARVESFGLTIDVLALPLDSANFAAAGARNTNIMRGTPERDRDIENICRCIEAASAAGIPCLKYNMTLLGVVSTHRTAGRGDASYRSFDFARIKDDPVTPLGRVDAETMWERIAYFVERVVPVAEAHGVKLACHPHDPAMPPETGYRGIDRVLGSVDGLKKFCALVDSPYHGLNFCQGTVSEMLDKPREQIFDVIRYFGERGKIFMVHYRNIRGGFLEFDEVYIDEGDVDMWETMKIYRDVGYTGIFCPDHVAKSAQDSAWGHRQRAFTAGYIKALIKAVHNP